MIQIYIDADACPVKEETYKVAARYLKKQARVLSPKGEEFTEDNIGSAVATRELMQNLRHMGEMRGGPAPMDKKARSQFLGKLDQIIQSLKKR